MRRHYQIIIHLNGEIDCVVRVFDAIKAVAKTWAPWVENTEIKEAPDDERGAKVGV